MFAITHTNQSAKTVVGAAIAFAMLLSAGCAVEEAGSGDGGDSATSSAKATKTKPDVKVGAAKLLKEFDRNELRADTKYKGKVLKVTGVVDKVDTEIFNEKKYVLQVAGGGDFEVFTVNCHDIPSNKLSKVDKGNKVTMIGKFKDGGDLGVELKDCRLGNVSG